MSRVKQPARSKRKHGRGHAGAVKTGCVRPRVAPATPNCPSEPERRPQSRAAQPARASARTLDGESARRLTTPDSSLTSNTVARAAATRGNDRINTRSCGLSFPRVWLPRAKNPGLSSGLRPGGEKIDSLCQGEMQDRRPRQIWELWGWFLSGPFRAAGGYKIVVMK